MKRDAIRESLKEKPEESIDRPDAAGLQPLMNEFNLVYDQDGKSLGVHCSMEIDSSPYHLYMVKGRPLDGISSEHPAETLAQLDPADHHAYEGTLAAVLKTASSISSLMKKGSVE